MHNGCALHAIARSCGGAANVTSFQLDGTDGLVDTPTQSEPSAAHRDCDAHDRPKNCLVNCGSGVVAQAAESPVGLLEVVRSGAVPIHG
jgi:hypothetical protein